MTFGSSVSRRGQGYAIPALGPGHRRLAEGVVHGLREATRVQPREDIPQTPLQDNLAVVGAVGQELARGDLQSMLDNLAEDLQPGEGGLFDDRFGHAAVGHAGTSASPSTLASSAPDGTSPP